MSVIEVQTEPRDWGNHGDGLARPFMWDDHHVYLGPPGAEHFDVSKALGHSTITYGDGVEHNPHGPLPPRGAGLIHDGTYDSYSGPIPDEHIEALQAHLGPLQPYRYDWNIPTAKVAAAWQIAESKWAPVESDVHRRPYYVDHSTGTIYLGQNGMHHNHLAQEFNLQAAYPQFTPGIMTSDGQHSEDELTPSSARDAVAQHLGVTLSEPEWTMPTKTAKPKAKKGEDVRALPQKCKECKKPAIKSLVWAEGMAYVPVCANHEAYMRKYLKDQDGEGAFQEIAIKERKSAYDWQEQQATLKQADTCEGDEDDYIDVIGQQAYDEWQFGSADQAELEEMVRDAMGQGKSTGLQALVGSESGTPGRTGARTVRGVRAGNGRATDARGAGQLPGVQGAHVPRGSADDDRPSLRSGEAGAPRVSEQTAGQTRDGTDRDMAAGERAARTDTRSALGASTGEGGSGTQGELESEDPTPTHVSEGLARLFSSTVDHGKTASIIDWLRQVDQSMAGWVRGKREAWWQRQLEKMENELALEIDPSARYLKQQQLAEAQAYHQQHVAAIDPFDYEWPSSPALTDKVATLLNETMYHVAPQAARQSILTHGLDFTKGKSGTNYKAIGSSPANYLWPTLEAAQAGRDNHDDGEWDIWAVHPHGLAVEADPYGGMYSGALRALDLIPPHRLTLLPSVRMAAAQTMYHISPVRNRQSIQRQGLTLSETPSPYIWLLNDPTLAQQAAVNTWGGSKDNDVWTVNVAGLNLQPDPHPGIAGMEAHSYISAQPIEPARLSLSPMLAILTQPSNLPSQPATPQRPTFSHVEPPIHPSAALPRSEPSSGPYDAPAQQELAAFLASLSTPESGRDSEWDLGPVSHSLRLRMDESGLVPLATPSSTPSTHEGGAQAQHTEASTHSSTGQHRDAQRSGIAAPSRYRPSLQWGLPYSEKPEAKHVADSGHRSHYQYSGDRGPMGSRIAGPGWSPGNYGKLLITPEGKIHHWSVEPGIWEDYEFDGQPDHAAYVTKSDIDPEDYRERLDEYTPGWISPKGQLWGIGDNRDAHLKAMAQRVPGTSFDGEDWTDPRWDFSANKGPRLDRTASLAQTKVIEYPQSESPDALWLDRRPVIYDWTEEPPQLHIGSPGDWHDDVREKAEENRHSLTNMPEGALFNDGHYESYADHGSDTHRDLEGLLHEYQLGQGLEAKQGTPSEGYPEFPTAKIAAIEIQPGVGDPDKFDEDEEGLYPVLWHPRANKLYVGNEGLHHADVIPHTGLSGHDPYHAGVVAVSPNENNRHWKPNEVWWDKVTPPEVTDALAQHFKLPLEHPQRDAIWDFPTAKTSNWEQDAYKSPFPEGIEPWRPGHLGKGLVSPDGRPYAWQIDDRHGRDGYPAHSQAIGALTGTNMSDSATFDKALQDGWSFFAINHDGTHDYYMGEPEHQEIMKAHLPQEPRCAGCGQPVQVDNEGSYKCPKCNWSGTYGQHPDEDDWEFSTAKIAAGLSDDMFTCATCGSHAMTEPKEITGRWMQKCTNCGRTRQVSPTHPLIQVLKRMQPEYPAMLQALDDRPMNYFGKTAMEIREHPGPGSHEDVLGDRIPILYQPNGERYRNMVGFDPVHHVQPDLLYVGAPGQSHGELEHHLGPMKAFVERGEYYPAQNAFNWVGKWNRRPRGHDDVMSHLQQRWPGVKFLPSEGDTDWGFPTAKTSAHEITWQPGNWGKALWYRDTGRIKAWPTDLGNAHDLVDGFPGHSEMYDNQSGREWSDEYHNTVPLLINPEGLVQSHDRANSDQAIAETARAIGGKPGSGNGYFFKPEDEWHIPTAKVSGPAITWKPDQWHSWTPGTYGKGMLINDKLYHWNTGTPSANGGAPHHLQAARALGIEPDFWDQIHDKRGQLYQIDPVGRVKETMSGAKVNQNAYAQAGIRPAVDPRTGEWAWGEPDDQWEIPTLSHRPNCDSDGRDPRTNYGKPAPTVAGG